MDVINNCQCLKAVITKSEVCASGTSMGNHEYFMTPAQVDREAPSFWDPLFLSQNDVEVPPIHAREGKSCSPEAPAKPHLGQPVSLDRSGDGHVYDDDDHKQA